MKKTKELFDERRQFIRQGVALMLSAAALPFSVQAMDRQNNDHFQLSPLPPDMVSEFVRAAHGNLERVKEMVAKEPRIVNACWDWGGGDFETALGGASHVGNREIGAYLLEHGAREDIFHAAMSGKIELVRSFVTAHPPIVNIPGPHRISLLYHVSISGDTKMADIVKPHLSQGSTDCNNSLHAAIRNGHVAMTEWLLRNGADDPNTPDFRGSTPLQSAEKNGNAQLVSLLKKFGAK